MIDYKNTTDQQRANARKRSGQAARQRAAQPQRPVDWDAAIERLKAMLAEGEVGP